ncbi:subtilisin-like serine endopeptidase family protein [Actinidia rufa]|uniref:Subtilisin-like serine endopeptidase family protein n=1 Tax=Actinidia rufa TaxID=165716 RepID=A0A7J0H5V2_9ERIC|nr:subtilisin-like serine endopeptidase family protein [Actinidia rufa]
MMNGTCILCAVVIATMMELYGLWSFGSLQIHALHKHCFHGHIFVIDQPLFRYLIPALDVYIVYLGQNRNHDPLLTTNHNLQLLSNVFARKEVTEKSMLYSCKHSFSGFSAMLNSTQATALAKMNEVVLVFRSRILELHTTRSWDFLGLTLPSSEATPFQLAYGDDVIVGIFDTGIWTESDSFKEKPGTGKCVPGEKFEPAKACNRELIGARYYLKGTNAYMTPVCPGRKLHGQTKAKLVDAKEAAWRANASALIFVEPLNRQVPDVDIIPTVLVDIIQGTQLFHYLVLPPKNEEFHREMQGILNSLAESWKAQMDALKDSLQAEIAAMKEEIKEVKDHEGEQKPSSPRHSRFNKDRRNGDKPKLSCFLYDGNHFARDCPQRVKLAALIRDDEEEPHQEEAKVGSLRLLNTIKAKVGKTKAPRKGRMYVEAKVRGFNTRALIDTGASHNFIEVKETKRLGLQLKEEQGWIKAVNTEVRPIYGVARDVRLHIGDWCGQVDFTVVPMDDYPIVLGMEFLNGVRAFPIPFAVTMFIMGEGSACMVPLAREALLKSKTLSAMQLSKEETSAKIPAAILTKSLGAFKSAKGWHADMAKAAKKMKKWAGKNRQTEPPNSKPKDSRDNPQPVVQISAGKMVIKQSPAPTVALFSSRGPSSLSPDILKDNILFGGIAKTADPLDIGAGHVDPLRAMDPGLVYDVKTSYYILFPCNIGYTIDQINSIVTLSPSTILSCPKGSYPSNENLNYTSITVSNLQSTVTIKRIVCNVWWKKAAIYFARIVKPNSVEVVVWPRVLIFSCFREEVSHYATFKPLKKSQGRYDFGELVWSDGFHFVRSPLVVLVGTASTISGDDSAVDKANI